MNDNTIHNLRAIANFGAEKIGEGLGNAAIAIRALVQKEPTPEGNATARSELNTNGTGAAKTASKHQYKNISYGIRNNQLESVTITKTNRKGKEIVKNYTIDKEIGAGGMGTAYRLNEIGKKGSFKQKFKVIKFAHDSGSARTAMTSGDDAMKGQHVSPKGKPTQVIGIIKPTKYIDNTNFTAITTLYELGDMNHVSLNTPKECFNFVGQTLFGLNHMHSEFEPKINAKPNFKDKIRAMLGLKIKNRKFEGKESIVHRDIKPGNMLCTEKNGKKQYVLMDFDGAHIAGAPNPTVVSTLGYRNINDDIHLKFGLDKGEVQKKVDVYALGLSFRKVITNAKLGDIIQETTCHNKKGYSIKHDSSGNRILMKPNDVPGFRNFSSKDKAKMMALTNLINQMTDDDYSKRPSPEASLRALKAIGIKVPKYST